MLEGKKKAVQARVDLLVAAFPNFLAYYIAEPPFKKTGQLEHHQRTIQLRREAGSASDALKSIKFLESLYATLLAWGIGARGSRLVPFKKFAGVLQEKTSTIDALEQFSIDQDHLPVEQVKSTLRDLVRDLTIVENRAKLVPVTKTLHHILPDLVVPIDRQYTQAFFGWHAPEFQYGQDDFLELSLIHFSEIARRTRPQQYVAPGWNSSRTKIIDNAIVGAICLAYDLHASGEKAG